MTNSEAIDIAKGIVADFESYANDADITVELYKIKNEDALVNHYRDYAAKNRREAEAIRVLVDYVSKEI